MDRFVSRESNVNHVGAGVEEQIDGRKLVEMRLLIATCAPLGWVLMLIAPMPAVSPPPKSFLNFPPILMSSVEPSAFSVGAK